MSCSGSLKKGRFGYQWQAALALVGPIYDTSVESTILPGTPFFMQHKIMLPPGAMKMQAMPKYRPSIFLTKITSQLHTCVEYSYLEKGVYVPHSWDVFGDEGLELCLQVNRLRCVPGIAQRKIYRMQESRL